MSTNHNHHHKESNLALAFLLNIGFTIIEIIGGYFTNSVAIIADAIHDLGDSCSFLFAWYMERFSSKRPNQQFTFGYQRFSLLGALVTGLILLTGSLLVLAESVPRLINPQQVDSRGMFLLAILGITVNGLAAMRTRKGTSLNEKMVSWHLFEDVLGWVAVFIVSIVMFFIDLPILDPILSILITIYILFGVIKNLRSTFVLFLQGVPLNLQIAIIEDTVNNVDGVLRVKHTHVWSLDGENHILTTHIVVEQRLQLKQIQSIKSEIRKQLACLGVNHATIEVEFESAVKTESTDDQPKEIAPSFNITNKSSLPPTTSQ